MIMNCFYLAMVHFRHPVHALMCAHMHHDRDCAGASGSSWVHHVTSVYTLTLTAVKSCAHHDAYIDLDSVHAIANSVTHGYHMEVN